MPLIPEIDPGPEPTSHKFAGKNRSCALQNQFSPALFSAILSSCRGTQLTRRFLRNPSLKVLAKAREKRGWSGVGIPEDCLFFFVPFCPFGGHFLTLLPPSPTTFWMENQNRSCIAHQHSLIGPPCSRHEAVRNCPLSRFLIRFLHRLALIPVDLIDK